MSPFDQAAEVYEREPCARSFDEDLFHHLRHGYVISTPQFFALLRPVQRDWPIAWLREPWRIDRQGNCWWLWLLAGDLVAGAQALPFPLPYIGYERENVPVIRRASRFISACKGRS
jgi:hypothetical protein